MVEVLMGVPVLLGVVVRVALSLVGVGVGSTSRRSGRRELVLELADWSGGHRDVEEKR